MLTDKIRVEQAIPATDPEDIFSSALGLIFTDDINTSHGQPDAVIVYKSSRFGDITLSTADPPGEDERRLFAHYLWNSGVHLAELIATDPTWSVTDETVLELGAGVGLTGIVSSLAGAREVVLSDYPTPELLENLGKNVKENMSSQRAPTVSPHEWGVLSDSFSSSRKGHFTRILAADCLWMPWQHLNLARSMLHFLSSEIGARVYVVAGFHTGRAKLAPFFDVAEEEGLAVDTIEEVDVVDNHTRPWVKERSGAGEDFTGRKRWHVVAKLKRQELRSQSV